MVFRVSNLPLKILTDVMSMARSRDGNLRTGLTGLLDLRNYLFLCFIFGNLGKS
jgi:hypothetical protein